MPETSCDQSMSELLVKFWAGTNFQVLRGLCCVIFRTPSIVLANLDLTYFTQARASASVSNEPIVRKVCVTATPGSTLAIHGDLAGRVSERRKVPLTWENEGVEATVLP